MVILIKSECHLPNEWRIIHIVCVIYDSAKCKQNQRANTVFSINILDYLKAQCFHGILELYCISNGIVLMLPSDAYKTSFIVKLHFHFFIYVHL